MSSWLDVQKLEGDAVLPSYGSAGAAGLDLYAANSVFLYPGKPQLIFTHIALSIPKGCVGMICERSSLAKRGIRVGGGIIDEDYRGEIKILLTNTSPIGTYQILKGDRVAQLLILPLQRVTVSEVKLLEPTERNESGFGSTGR